MKQNTITLMGGLIVGGSAAVFMAATTGLHGAPLAAMGAGAGVLWQMIYIYSGTPEKEDTATWEIEPARPEPRAMKPDRITVLPLPDEKPKPQRTVGGREKFEKHIVQTIAYAWTEATYQHEQGAPGQYAIDVMKPRWYSGFVRFDLRLSQMLPTPQVQSVVQGQFAMALRAAIAQSTKRKDMIERIGVKLEHGTVEITMPRPGKAPDLHARNMQHLHRPAVSLAQRSPDGDLYALAGLDQKDNPVHVDFALTAAVLAVGATRSGKTALVFAMLLDLLANNPPSRVNLYIVGARGDQWREFVNTPHCKGYAFDEHSATSLLTKVQQLTQANASMNADGMHPSNILVVDDLSGVSQFPTWDNMRESLNYIVMSGGGAATYTIMTSHRTTEAGGVGKGARALALNAGCRLATATQGGSSILADHLSVSQSQAEAIPMPKAQAEAAVSNFGEPPRIIRTVYAKPHDVAHLVEGVEECSRSTNKEEAKCTTPTAPTAPLERNRGVANFAGHSDYTRSVDATAPGYIPASVRNDVIERDGNQCQWCFGEGDDSAGPDGHSWEFDHVWPTSKGGPDTFDNVVRSCRTCNRRKGDMEPGAWAKKRLLELDGTVPEVRKVKRQWAPSLWDQLRIAFAFDKGMSITSIADNALGSRSSHNNNKVKEFIETGRQVLDHLRGV